MIRADWKLQLQRSQIISVLSCKASTNAENQLGDFSARKLDQIAVELVTDRKLCAFYKQWLMKGLKKLLWFWNYSQRILCSEITSFLFSWVTHTSTNQEQKDRVSCFPSEEIQVSAQFILFCFQDSSKKCLKEAECILVTKKHALQMLHFWSFLRNAQLNLIEVLITRLLIIALVIPCMCTTPPARLMHVWCKQQSYNAQRIIHTYILIINSTVQRIQSKVNSVNITNTGVDCTLPTVKGVS